MKKLVLLTAAVAALLSACTIVRERDEVRTAPAPAATVIQHY